MKRSCVLCLVLATADAGASPNVSLDDPVYVELDKLAAPFSGGFAPLTEARIHDLLGVADAPHGWWIDPIDRAAATVALFHDSSRPYDTPLRPRQIAGAIDVACERQEGRPCGDGANVMTEVDSAAGYGRWVSAATRLRVQHTPHGFGLDVDRLYVNAELGPVAAEVGRDVVVLGPSSRTQLGWGENAPPLDHVRLSTIPLRLTDELRGSLAYVVGRLRDPQTYPKNLVTIARGELDIAGVFDVGMMQELQLGGDGAPSFGVVDFVLEHLTRRDLSAGTTDSSNRRVGFDFAARIAGLHGARLYYQIIFEDWRQQFLDAIRYDADHLFGVDVARHGFTLEVMKTGVRSGEHTPRVTGFTSGGHSVGAPLGPDATSVFASERLAVGQIVLVPWVEYARLSSDTFAFFGDGSVGISPATRGVAEHRYRAGTSVQVSIDRALRTQLDVTVEHVTDFAFDPAARRSSVGAVLSVVWTPRTRLEMGP